jgi:precorrin-2 dehydrogenase/sirohydrochlorin ferrochelatase
MRYYPALLDVKNRRCLVVGGGRVGTRKVKTLMACGAKVRVVTLEATDELLELARGGRIELHKRPFEEQDLDRVFLVIGATDDQKLNQRIHALAEEKGRLCNIADQPELCNFVLPSIVNQGDLTIAISTAGRSPAFAKHLRRCLQSQFGPEYGRMLELMGAIRTRLLSTEHAPEFHKPLFERLIADGLLGLIKAGREEEIDALLARVLGPEYRYRQLMTTP